jgi:hypothetical protein
MVRLATFKSHKYYGVWGIYCRRGSIQCRHFERSEHTFRSQLNIVQLNSKMPTGNLGPEVSIAETVNTTGGFHCYVYE